MLNYQRNDDPTVTTTVIGPAVTASKMIVNNTIRTSFAVAYNNFRTGTLGGYTLNSRLMMSYRLKKAHNFQASIISVQRQRAGENETTSSELTGSLGYNYSF